MWKTNVTLGKIHESHEFLCVSPLAVVVCRNLCLYLEQNEFLFLSPNADQKQSQALQRNPQPKNIEIQDIFMYILTFEALAAFW